MSDQQHAPTYFTPGKDPVHIVQEAGWVPGPVWTGGKSLPTGTRSPDRPARSQSLYRLNYRAHACYVYSCIIVNNELDGIYKETVLMGSNKSVDAGIILKWCYKEMWQGGRWIHLALNGHECETVMKLCFPQKKNPRFLDSVGSFFPKAGMYFF